MELSITNDRKNTKNIRRAVSRQQPRQVLMPNTEAFLKIVRPLVLLSHLCLLLRGEVAHNVQVLTNLLDGLVLDEAGNAGRAQVKERRNIKVVSCEGQVVKSVVVGAHDEGGIELLDQLGKISILKRL